MLLLAEFRGAWRKRVGPFCRSHQGINGWLDSALYTGAFNIQGGQVRRVKESKALIL